MMNYTPLLHFYPLNLQNSSYKYGYKHIFIRKIKKTTIIILTWWPFQKPADLDLQWFSVVVFLLHFLGSVGKVLISRNGGLPWCNHAFHVPCSTLISPIFICYFQADETKFLLAGAFHLLTLIFMLDEQSTLWTGSDVWTHGYPYNRLSRTGLKDLQSCVLPSATCVPTYRFTRSQPGFQAVPAKLV